MKNLLCLKSKSGSLIMYCKWKSAKYTEATFSFERFDYLTQEQAIELPTGQTAYKININLVLV